ncbi:uncharacterized protein LOC135832904 [Planococcus citri]|uniref:uncharacterized protein LOC135832904 n=1 Tax=Planococcus citri TaxID=170843 RepID=UPI0031F99A4F
MSVIETAKPSSSCTDQKWENFKFKMNESIDCSNIRKHSLDLLQDPNTSILGDMCVNVEGEKYILDRVILALKSNYFRVCFGTQDNGDDVNSFQKPKAYFDCVKGGKDGLHTLISIIYGKDLKSAMNKNNFLNLFHNMFVMGMEIDLEIIKQFLEENIKPEVKFYFDIIEFERFLCDFMGSNHLLPTIVQFLSHHLPKIYRMLSKNVSKKELLVLILMNKSYNLYEKRLIGTMCAEWICQDFQNRIQDLKDLVNATKYRFNLLPYCDLSSESMIKLLKKTRPLGKPGIPEIEKYFDELLSYDGEANYELPANLNAELYNLVSGERICSPIDEINAWKSFLKDEFLCDVAIHVQGTIFKLHRIKLLSASGFFYHLLVHPELRTRQLTEKSDFPIEEFSINEIDPVTFKSIIRYIYYEEIEITSLTQLMNLFKSSEFLEMSDLFDKCSSKMLDFARNAPAYFFEIFRFVCENHKYSKLYDSLVRRIVNLWPKLAEDPHFKDVSLRVIQEIIALPRLKIDHPDHVLDLCAEWIFYDVENRYQFTTVVARAINRNLTSDIELPLATPSNSVGHTQQSVKEQLIKILSSTTLVPSPIACGSNLGKTPCFIVKCLKKIPKPENEELEMLPVEKYYFDELLYGEANFLTIVDVYFNEIIRLAQIRENTRWQCSATMIDIRLFILFNIDKQFYFQVYNPSTNVMTTLATDVRMNSNDVYTILNCDGEVYFCSNEILLKYSVELNRWITFICSNTRIGNLLFTSDGKKLYRTFVELEPKSNTFVNKSSFFDFGIMKWISMPNIPVPVKITRDVEGFTKFSNIPLQINIINRDLSVLFESKTFVFNYMARTWNSINNVCKNAVQFTSQGQNIVYVNRKNEAHLFSPISNKWTLAQKLSEDFDRIIAIHHINEYR